MTTLTPDSWQKELAQAIRSPQRLLSNLELDPESPSAPRISSVPEFPILVTRHFMNKIRKGDWHDPLLRQILPLNQEQQLTPGYSANPVGDLESVTTAGILKKYSGRALIITTESCPVHCRYCFRKEFPYSDNQASRNNWQAVIESLARDQSIHEIILSGGDPLSLSNTRLESLIRPIGQLKHIKTLRIHTRYPVTLPERFDPGLMQLLDSVSCRTVMVIHANHPNELDETCSSLLQDLANTRLTLLNQSVLLRGVNDDADTLKSLSFRLWDAQVLPYYLHLLDPVSGTAHFAVPEAEASRLITDLRHELPGYLVPKPVRELSGKRSKTPIV